MKTANYFIVILLFQSLSSFAQIKNEELMQWNANKKLNWSDYKADPNPGSDAAASTSTYLLIDYNIRNDGLTYRIQSLFSKTRSWGLHKSAYILSHEQGHFDIAEIFARKLHKKMSAYNFNKKTYQQDLDKIYNDIVEEKSAFQNRYDKETNHSINKEKQAEWLILIESLLNEYKDYADY